MTAGTDKIAQHKIINRLGEAFSPLLFGDAMGVRGCQYYASRIGWVAHQAQAGSTSGTFYYCLVSFLSFIHSDRKFSRLSGLRA
jgi:hypothetical protein